ncbi:MAG: methionine--tRNA ligase [Candidatus Korobacteraceae bacterium]
MENEKASKKFYITTPIYYVNARPHIGHTYTTMVCDAIARRQRLLGRDTFFLTGTDEHGQKIERSAAAAGKSPQQFADEISGEFRALWDRLGITYDKFIRTTSAEHKRGTQEMFKLLQQRGYIYKGSYSGQYCVFDELYVDVNTPGAPCPECGRPTETVREENYFFKLSAMEEPLLKLYAENPDFIRPESRRNEVIAFVRSGLRDLSVSRTTFTWGIPVPGDPAHVIYVWLDALCNYITALGFGAPEVAQRALYERYWPGMHMVGKEIVRFHCVYWPAFLLAAGLPLPTGIVAHGWLLFEESKMSKSRGNIVRSETILDVLGADALRYFLMREIVFGQDGSFSFDALVQRYNADLANGLGNLASRTLSMITRYFRGEVPYPERARTPGDEAIAQLAAKVIADFNESFDAFQFSRALESAWSLVAAVDKYIVENEPWALAEKQDEESRSRLATILYTSAEALRIVTALAHPVLPDSTARIWSQLGLDDIRKLQLNELKWGELKIGTRLGKVEAVFPRADKSVIEKMQQLETEGRTMTAASSAAQPAPAIAAEPAKTTAQASQPTTPAPTAASTATATGTISIDDFAKIDLRVALVKVAEPVKGTDKLMRLEVDLGTETRQIVAGIAKAYTPEQLIGRKIVIVANLAPRKLRGLESKGMLLAASIGEQGTPVLAGFLEDVPVGAKLK